MAEAAAVPDEKLEVFISYAREDRDAAQRLATALIDAGRSVWWDRHLAGGQDFTDVIAERLAAARVVLVLWSSASVGSGFVRDESARARDAGKLLPLRIEDVRVPLGFGTIHTLDLIDWDGDRDDPGFAELLADLQRGPAGVPVAGPGRTPRNWPRWRKPLAVVALLAALGGAAVFAWDSWREQQALEQFQQGLSWHFAPDRNLQAARNAYISALRIEPELGRAHYYLAHVYALLILPRDARVQFGEALRFARDLDEAQRDDARVQLAALDPRDEPPPVARAEPATAAPGTATKPGTDSSGSGSSGGTDVGDPAPAAAPQVAARPAPSPAMTSSSTRARTGAVRTAPMATPEARATVAAAARLQPVAHLPRVPPPAEQQRALAEQVQALFAPLAQTRLSAATAIALDPAALSDALPLALQRSLAALQAAPSGEAAIAGAANTVQLLLSASPATLHANRETALQLIEAVQGLGENQQANARQARALLDKAQDAAPPLAYIQIANEAQRPVAMALAQRMRASGYAVPGIENVGARAPSRSEVRVQGASVQGWGRWLAKLLGEVTGEPARISTLRSTRPAKDTFEIWFDKDLCASEQRRAPGCGPA